MTDKIEYLARLICEAHVGYSSETLIVVGQPTRIDGLDGYVAPPENYARPLWTTYLYAAQCAVRAGFDRPDESSASLAETTEEVAPEDVDARPVETFGTDRVAEPVNERRAAMAEWKERVGLA